MTLTLKSGCHSLEKTALFALKIMKNAFYFTLKALFVLKIFKILSRLFVHVEKTAGLER